MHRRLTPGEEEGSIVRLRGSGGSHPCGRSSPAARPRLRAIRVGDRPRLQRFHASLSKESRYRRFHGVKQALSDRDLVYLTDVDHRTHVAVVALREDGEIAAVARVIAAGDRTAEVAVVVRDDCQRSGVGTAVTLAALERFARRGPGCPVMAHVQGDNHAALRFFADRLGGLRESQRNGVVSIRLGG